MAVGPAGLAASVRQTTTQVSGSASAMRLPMLPLGGRKIFPRYFLVAYYGTAGTPALGVLGEAPPDRITKRLRAAARPYARSGRQVQIVYELIVTIADATRGSDGTYSHDIARSHVRRFIQAAERNKALLLLDLQPGRQGFLKVAKRWAWALRHKWVGLALDSEWRMHGRQVPAEQIGHVGAPEVNRVSRWLSGIVARRDLPEKVLMVHQFRTDMVRNIAAIRPRRGLALIQHVDGFGSQRQKLATYHRVERHRRFDMGFKLFYDEDSNLFRPPRVLRIRPRVELVSYQ